MKVLPLALRVGFLAMLAGFLAGQSDTAHAEQVNCYDRSNDTLSVVGRTTCKHQIVSTGQATAIRQERRAYIQRSMRNGATSPAQSDVSSYGSGFFVHPSGYVVTNHHVANRCRQISLLTHSGKSISAALVASSAREDLALLKTQGPISAYATLQKSALTAGSRLQVVGFPVRKLPRQTPKTVTGKYAGERPLENGNAVMKIDVQVWQGSSGSPVIDRRGSVVGVIFAKANIPAIYEKTGHIPNDRAYAMPTSVLSAFLKRNNVEPRQLLAGQTPASPNNYLVRVDCYH